MHRGPFAWLRVHRLHKMDPFHLRHKTAHTARSLPSHAARLGPTTHSGEGGFPHGLKQSEDLAVGITVRHGSTRPPLTRFAFRCKAETLRARRASAPPLGRAQRSVRSPSSAHGHRRLTRRFQPARERSHECSLSHAHSQPPTRPATHAAHALTPRASPRPRTPQVMACALRAITPAGPGPRPLGHMGRRPSSRAPRPMARVGISNGTGCGRDRPLASARIGLPDRRGTPGAAPPPPRKSSRMRITHSRAPADTATAPPHVS